MNFLQRIEQVEARADGRFEAIEARLDAIEQREKRAHRRREDAFLEQEAEGCRQVDAAVKACHRAQERYEFRAPGEAA